MTTEEELFILLRLANTNAFINSLHLISCNVPRHTYPGTRIALTCVLASQVLRTFLYLFYTCWAPLDDQDGSETDKQP